MKQIYLNLVCFTKMASTLKNNNTITTTTKTHLKSHLCFSLGNKFTILLNSLFVFRNDLYVNLLYYMYTCCYKVLSLGFPTSRNSNQTPQSQRLARKLKFHYMILSNTEITNALIRMYGCAGLVFAFAVRIPQRHGFLRVTT